MYRGNGSRFTFLPLALVIGHKRLAASAHFSAPIAITCENCDTHASISLQGTYECIVFHHTINKLCVIPEILIQTYIVHVPTCTWQSLTLRPILPSHISSIPTPFSPFSHSLSSLLPPLKYFQLLPALITLLRTLLSPFPYISHLLPPPAAHLSTPSQLRVTLLSHISSTYSAFLPLIYLPPTLIIHLSSTRSTPCI